MKQKKHAKIRFTCNQLIIIVSDMDSVAKQGKGFDIHKAIVKKLPRPKAVFTPVRYKYMGAYHPLEKKN